VYLVVSAILLGRVQYQRQQCLLHLAVAGCRIEYKTMLHNAKVYHMSEASRLFLEIMIKTNQNHPVLLFLTCGEVAVMMGYRSGQTELFIIITTHSLNQILSKQSESDTRTACRQSRYQCELSSQD
jgi:hypothetical protein